jgi:hypothetical protein
LDPTTGLPAKVASVEDHPPLGDAVVEVIAGATAIAPFTMV